MQRAGAVFLLMTLSFLGGLISTRTQSRDILFNISYLLAILLLVSFVWTWINIRTIQLTRITRARRAQVGRSMEERFTITNTSRLPKLWMEMRDHSELPDHRASHVVKRLPGKGRYAWRVNTICLQRGRYMLGPITLTCSDPFGLFQMQRELTPTSHVVIYPMTVEIARFALPVGILPGGDALRRRTHYITANAAGVRDYVPGDSFNRIHWRSAARQDQLIVKEFELDPLADIWLFPDLHGAVQLSMPASTQEKALHTDRPLRWAPLEKHRLAPNTEEYTVTVAATLAQHFLRRDRAVGMITHAQEREVIQADRGERQLSKILETLAVARGQGNVPIEHVLYAEVNQLPRGATLIIITPATSEPLVTLTRHLERRGVRVILVLVDPASFGASFSADGVATMLRAGGTPTYVVRRDDSLEEVLAPRAGAQHFYSVA